MPIKTDWFRVNTTPFDDSSDLVRHYLPQHENDEFYRNNEIVFYRPPAPKAKKQIPGLGMGFWRPGPDENGVYEFEFFIAYARFQEDTEYKMKKETLPSRYHATIDMVLVSWLGWGHTHNTWEPYTHVRRDCLFRWFRTGVAIASSANCGDHMTQTGLPMSGTVCLPRRRILMSRLMIEVQENRFLKNMGVFCG